MLIYLQKTVAEKVQMMASQAAVVVDSMRSGVPPMSGFTSQQEEPTTVDDEDFITHTTFTESHDMHSTETPTVFSQKDKTVKVSAARVRQQSAASETMKNMHTTDVKHLKPTMLKNILEKSKPPKQTLEDLDLDLQNTVIGDPSQRSEQRSETSSQGNETGARKKRVSVTGSLPKSSKVSMADFKNPKVRKSNL